MSGPIVLALRTILAVFLYGFLVWGLIMLWKNIRQQGASLAGRKIPPLSLTIQPEKQPPQVRRFTRAEIIIGRDPSADCPLEDETASAQHIRLSYHHGQWWAEDTHSTNGTLLNKHRLALPTVIVSDDELTCGQTRITIGLEDILLNPPTLPLTPPSEKE
jgi:pSer/pThr/pTyr-binding forkhead associated (FHA) protein